jgi:HNH endonuclease
MSSDRKIPKKIRLFVAQRALLCCEYCLVSAEHSSDHFSLDHILPLILLGTHELINLAYSCQGCNGHKHAKTHGFDTISSKRVALFNPRIDNWKSHFEWAEDYTIIVGLTPTGRATVEAIKLNREPLVKLRKLLRPSGVLPPAYSL